GPDSIRSVESNVDATRSYFADHWPLFAGTDDLKKALDELTRRVSEEDPFNLHLDDDDTKPASHDGGSPPGPAGARTEPAGSDASAWLDGKEPLPREKVAERFARYKDGFLVHPDGKS